MLILKRKREEEVVITVAGVRVVVKIAGYESGCVRLAFDAPTDVQINRREVQDEIDARRAGK